MGTCLKIHFIKILSNFKKKNMRKEIIISGLCMLSFWFCSCTDPFAKEEFMAYEEQPIGLHLESQAQYSQWVKLLKIADLFNALNMNNVKYTCFVANNDAVDAYIQASGKWKTVDDLKEDEAKNLLKYHIIPVDYAYSSLSIGRIGTPTVSGDYLTITFDHQTDRYIKEAADSVKILEKGGEVVPQINGYYHEIESVLNPIINTVMEVLDESPDYTIFTQALTMCGLDAYLNQRDIVVGEMTLRDYKAVFVVSDSIFHTREIYNIDSLRNRYTGEPTDVNSDFYKFMGFHILEGVYDYGALTEFSATSSKGANFETYIDGEFICMEKNLQNEIFLNPLGDDVDLQIIKGKYNIQGCNGFIHEISGLMAISEPIRYRFEWEPTEWPEFKQFEHYRESRLKNDGKTTYAYFEEETEHIRWNTIPYKKEAVGYLNEDVDYDQFKYDDGLMANLGKVGWVEFDTPILMRGEYNISMVKYSWFECKGDFQMYIDGLKFGNKFACSGGDMHLDMGDYTFTKSEPHVFRFNVVGQDGMLRLDRFIFTPINE